MNKKLHGLIDTFPYQDTSIAGINGKPFIDFSAYKNDYDFNIIDEELCLYFARTELNQIPMVSGQIPTQLSNEYSNLVFEDEYIQNLSDIELSSLKHLDIPTRRKYLYYRNKILLPWTFILVLKPNMFKSKNQDINPWEPFVDSHLAYTKSFIQSLPFKHIGRVVIYGSWGGSLVPCHRDGYLEKHKDHHINFNPGGYRPVFVYDPIKNKKTYLNKNYKLYAYNVRDYHGVDSIPNFSYTVRVDGEYTDNVINKIGIVDGII